MLRKLVCFAALIALAGCSSVGTDDVAASTEAILGAPCSGSGVGTCDVGELCVSSVCVADTDSDGVANANDIDDDNDGILDVDECPVPADALVYKYSQVFACSASANNDGVMAMSNAPTLPTRVATYATSMTDDPTDTPPAGVVGEFMHPDWTVRRIGSVYFTEYGPDSSVYMPASQVAKGEFGGTPVIRTGEIGDAATSGTGFDGWDVIYKTDPVTGAPSAWATVDTAGRGFGGITYNAATNSFYVANIGRLRIHQLDPAGNVLSSFVPSLATITGFTQFPFGLDINPDDGRLYYTVPDPRENGRLVVRSVALNTAGAFRTSTDRLEFSQNSLVGTNEGRAVVADIDFKPDGTMALGSFSSEEILGDAVGFYEGDLGSVYNHNGYDYVFGKAAGVWNRTAASTIGQEFYTGMPNATATGGVAWNGGDRPDLYWASGGDFRGENSRWGIIGYDSTTFANTATQEDSDTYIQFLFPPFGGSSDPKGNGADVDIFDTSDMGVFGGCDTDGDGVSDEVDLDSDNDGIADLVEAGATAAQLAADSNDNGTISLSESADSDGDGLLNIFEPTDGNDPVDTDGDGVPDFLDLDADNDCIPDTVEARPTVGYDMNDGDVSNDDSDGDGVINLFDTNSTFGASDPAFVDPEDTDMVGAADFRDNDSDGDGASDKSESGLPAGTDNDNDGIADVIGASYEDPDGLIDDPRTDLDNEVGDTTEVGYRETAVPDADGDGVEDAIDLDDDNDGIRDQDEMPGFAGTDPGADDDSDGVPNWNDPDEVACADTAPADGVCDSLPTALDRDGDGVPNHLDRDADDDGITDAFEAGLDDADGDGIPDGCFPIRGNGTCRTGALSGAAPDTDGTGGPDYLDPDSDGDGISDAIEAHDTNGNGVINGSETRPTGMDSDGDGIDNAYDSDGGDPITEPLGAVEDSDGNGTPDWLETCVDGYVTSGEACDDGDSDDTNECNNSCRGVIDSDDDGVPDEDDLDDDNDGILDTTEVSGFGGSDPGADDDLDGIPNWNDPDEVSCPDVAPPIGECDTLPSSIDEDGDGVPNHLDLDADDDGITDAREAGLDDVDGDGNPDACFPVLSSGRCRLGGLVGAPPNTDGDSLPDYLDPDSDGDGITDAIEAHDTNGNGVIGDSETRPTGNDSDGDGIDNAYDPDSAGGDPITDPLGAVEDSDGNGTPDWLETCVDGYVTGTEACDDGDADDTNECSNSCRGLADTDGDGVPDPIDVDDDNDGILDTTEVSGFGGSDPGADDDADGIPNWQDPNEVPCVDRAPRDGVCDSLPASIDEDGDGVPNHLDLDADDDGITDALEAGLDDSDGDGNPDRCVPVVASGRCRVGFLSGAPPNTDGADEPDYLDPDSDNDGLTDATEAHDANGNGSIGGGETSPTGMDTDRDGIDDAYDPDAPGGDPITTPFGRVEDSDRNGTPDWLEVCVDGYVTGTEACDDGDASNGNECSNVCLRNIGEDCTDGAQCTSMLCDPTSNTCQSCADDTRAGVDTGCDPLRPACIVTAAGGICSVCDDDRSGAVADDGCSAASPICDTSAGATGGRPECVTCVNDMAGGATDSGCPGDAPRCDESVAGGECVTCFTSAQCNDENDCTQDRCVAGECTATDRPAGFTCEGTDVCDGMGMCEECINDSASGRDSGCPGETPLCDAPMGDTGMCVECLVTADCGAGEFCNPANECTPGCTRDADCPASAPVCDEDAMTCVTCINNAAGAAQDEGCSAATPICEAAMGEAGVSCASCVNDVAGGGTDTGCSDDAPRCDPDAAGGAGRCSECTTNAQCDDGNECTRDRCVSGSCDVTDRPLGAVCDTTDICDGDGACVECVNTMASGTDDGCPGRSPFCNAPMGDSGMCVECLMDGDCARGELCNAANECAPGCDDDSDCGGETPVCDTAAMSCVTCVNDMAGTATDSGCSPGEPLCDAPAGDAGAECVECVTSSDCAVGEMCNPLNECEMATIQDNDGDGVPDDGDIDDDNDGILDTQELGGTDLSDDDDMDGVPDYRDPDSVTCEDADANGTCDFLPSEVDFDGDGIPNHFDLDDDADGIPDATEGHDANADGVPDTEPLGMDTDGDGLDDAFDPDQAGTPAPVQDFDGDGQPDFLDVDSDDDGVLDLTEGNDADHDGEPDSLPTGSDLNGDGLDDAFDPRSGGTAAPVPDTDGDMHPDYLDIDSDNDGVVDATEAWDEDADGVPDTLPVGADTNANGLDDAYDPVIEAGVPAPKPDFDEDGRPDYLDIDSDGDSVLDATEAYDADSDGVPDVAATPGEDADGDGLLDSYDPDDGGTEPPAPDLDGDEHPNYLDVDSDGDGLPDLTEANDANFDGVADITPAGTDTDLDGLDDASDPDDGGTPPTSQDLDGDGRPDYLDFDSDNDGIPDIIEGHDGSGDGDPDVPPSGLDTDNDGLDDAYDPSVGGTPSPLPDMDMDMHPNHLDVDSDGDGIPDEVECPDPTICPDTDGDDAPDYLDLDSDGDNVPDSTEGHDADSDGVPDATPSGSDMDMDGLDDAYDPDNGGTAAPTQDTDGDGTPDYQDVDDDGDMLPTAGECVDALMCADEDGDGTPDYLEVDDTIIDTDGDGIPDVLECTDVDDCEDTDGDGIPNNEDPDDDEDGIPTAVEAPGGVPVNTDGTGGPDHLDIDADDDGIPDAIECDADPCPDTDMDGTPDRLDLDTDGDGIPDLTEGHDADMDGFPGASPTGDDTDMDGLDDAFDGDDGGMPAPTQDSDEDGTPDWRDTEDDGDGIDTAFECTDASACPDEDGDGMPDYLDADSDPADDDMDGIPNTVECPPPGDLSNPETCPDTDGDGLPNFNDPDDDNDGILTADENYDGDQDPTDEDTDRDGIPDYLDTDDDQDGVPTIEECPDPAMCPDTDGDGRPDYRDVCGDGRTTRWYGVTVWEQCDDGNNVSGDGCSASCRLEGPACTTDADCPTDAPRCDTEINRCVECLEDGDCPDGMCDLESRMCVGRGCMSDDDCPDDEMCDIDSGMCVGSGCRDDDDCGGDTPFCDEEEGICVGCTDDTECPVGFCDDLTRMCVDPTLGGLAGGPGWLCAATPAGTNNGSSPVPFILALAGVAVVWRRRR